MSRQQTNDDSFCVVKDPRSGKYFRFQEVEQFICEQLDGETSPEVIRHTVETKFDAALSIEALNEFIHSLQGSGLIEGVASQKPLPGLKGRLKGNLLYLRFMLFDPSTLFDHLVRRTAFFFSHAFVVFSFLCILIGIWTMVSNWTEFAQDLPRLYDFAAVPMFIGTNLLMITMHEFGHGLTLRNFGGEVHEIGFMMIYFQPAFYCNVSDAWLLQEKSKRLWVSFAGPYFELFLWSLATLAWRITETETWLNYLGLMVMTTSGVKTLANFNPLIKLDGYYLLSDFLDIPNLRGKSFRYIGDLTKRLTGSSMKSPRKLTGREQFIYLIYGGIATVFSFFLFGYGTMQLGGFLIENNQPIPLAVFAGFAGLRFRDRLARLFGSSKSKTKNSDTTPLPSGQISEQPPSAPTGGKKIVTKKRITRYIVGLAGLLIAAFLIFGWMELIVQGPFVILPVHNADVHTEVEGIIEEIRFREGDLVQAGDVIAHLTEHENRTELEKTEAQINEAHARLKMLQTGATQQEIDLARTNVATLKERLKFIQGRLERNRLLFERDLLTRIEYENSQELGIDATGQLAEAQKRLDLVLRRTRPEQLDEVNAQIARLEIQKQLLQEKLQHANVR
ncbi:MAG TPA: biotin/lipoyl-binding protein, partial [Bacteroidota bacterium]|nr:biotin/lipoyl-binding protein [Bacteroidota bacterium]